ncbi:hypothetical protein E4H12_06300 [Candidatus Thorarchaeota archaeon]|nr:MAG: hypothetical protein E4H12_06300 [Candidatus Thorarchaeota archaeon]
MSKHHTSSVFARVHHDIRRMLPAELEETYGIEIGDEIFDPAEMKSFPTIEAWADYVIEQEKADQTTFIKSGGKQYFDDEY